MAQYKGDNDAVYDVKVYEDGGAKDTCTCYRGQHLSLKGRACKHILHLRNSTVPKGTNVVPSVS